MINTIIVLIAVDAVAMAISEGEPETGAADDAESLHESEAVDFSSLAVDFSSLAVNFSSLAFTFYSFSGKVI